MTDSFIARELRRRMDAKGFKQKALAIKADLNETYVRDILKGKSKNPEASKLARIAAALGCSSDDLLGKGPTVQPTQTTQIEVRGDVQAGLWREAIEWPAIDWYAITVPLDTAYKGFHRYGLKVCGQSMNKVFPEGSVVVVINFGDLGVNPKTGDFVIAVQRNDTGEYEATVKAVQIQEDGTVILWPQSWDPAFQSPIIIPAHDGHDQAGAPDIAIQALVVGSYQPNPKALFL
ncbi:MAG: LexA family transcriptional regulator [Gluconobacter sp.]|uniref:helix-turn-helix domain-containing protein n=1 Tax=Gluconobacter sp. TaxID=1876758 RepID=UPI0039ED66E9